MLLFEFFIICIAFCGNIPSGWRGPCWDGAGWRRGFWSFRPGPFLRIPGFRGLRSSWPRPSSSCPRAFPCAARHRKCAAKWGTYTAIWIGRLWVPTFMCRAPPTGRKKTICQLPQIGVEQCLGTKQHRKNIEGWEAEFSLLEGKCKWTVSWKWYNFETKELQWIDVRQFMLGAGIEFAGVACRRCLRSAGTLGDAMYERRAPMHAGIELVDRRQLRDQVACVLHAPQWKQYMEELWCRYNGLLVFFKKNNDFALLGDLNHFLCWVAIFFRGIARLSSFIFERTLKSSWFLVDFIPGWLHPPSPPHSCAREINMAATMIFPRMLR